MSPAFVAARFVSRWIAEPFLFVGLTASVYGFLLADGLSYIDFETFRTASLDVLAGRSPYPPPDPAVLATEKNFVYPPLAAYLFAPFAVVPHAVGLSLFLALVVLAAPATLLVLGVRDWRCVCVALMAAPTVNAFSVGALSTTLALAVALAWRFRNRLLPAAVLVGAIVVSKLFLWPLLVWLAATRRTRTAVLAALVGGAAALGSWAVLGFAGLADYGKTVQLLSEVLQDKSYSPVALGLSLGVEADASRLLAMVLGAALLVTTVVLARRPDGDRRALSAALGAALALSPIVWTHYFALLFVPLALARPRFSVLWLLPVALWVAPGQSLGNVWLIAPSIAIAAVAIAVGAWPVAGRARVQVPHAVAEATA